MKNLLLPALLLLFSAGPALAQEPGFPGPAPELARLKAFEGSWRASGTVRFQADAPETRWTSKGTAKWVLGGHFLEEQLRVDFAPDSNLPPLVFRSFYGFDRERRRYAVATASNLGMLELKDAFWVGEDAFVIQSLTIEDGVPALNRETLKPAKEGYEFTIESARGAGPLVVLVKGSSRRADEGYQIGAADYGSFFGPPGRERGREMEKFKDAAGAYRVKGTFVMAPGAEPFPIAARETVHSYFQGSVFGHHVAGDPVPDFPRFEGWGFIAWDEANGRYSQVWIDNMGNFGRSNAFWTEDRRLVATTEMLHMGQPMVERSIIDYGEDGKLKRVVSDRITSTHQPERVFEAEYSKAE
jgi:hypothetical protein